MYETYMYKSKCLNFYKQSVLVVGTVLIVRNGVLDTVSTSILVIT